MNPVSNAISSLSAAPYVDAFTTGEITCFVVLIIASQIIITAASAFIVYQMIRMDAINSHNKIIKGLDIILDRLPERIK